MLASVAITQPSHTRPTSIAAAAAARSGALRAACRPAHDAQSLQDEDEHDQSDGHAGDLLHPVDRVGDARPRRRPTAGSRASGATSTPTSCPPSVDCERAGDREPGRARPGPPFREGRARAEREPRPTAPRAGTRASTARARSTTRDRRPGLRRPPRRAATSLDASAAAPARRTRPPPAPTQARGRRSIRVPATCSCTPSQPTARPPATTTGSSSTGSRSTTRLGGP